MGRKKQAGMKVKLWIHKEGTDQVLAGQRNATLDRSAETIDSTSKDSEGFWTESLAGFKSFSIDCDGAFVESDEAYEILEDAFMNNDGEADSPDLTDNDFGEYLEGFIDGELVVVEDGSDNN